MGYLPEFPRGEPVFRSWIPSPISIRTHATGRRSGSFPFKPSAIRQGPAEPVFGYGRPAWPFQLILQNRACSRAQLLLYRWQYGDGACGTGGNNAFDPGSNLDG